MSSSSEFEFKSGIFDHPFSHSNSKLPLKLSHSNLRLQLNQPGDGYLAVSAYVKEHISEISYQNAEHYTPSPPQKQGGAETFA